MITKPTLQEEHDVFFKDGTMGRFRLRVEVEKILCYLAARAKRSKGKKSRVMNGDIEVKMIS